MMLPSWKPGGIFMHFRLELACFLKHKSVLIILEVKEKKDRWVFGPHCVILMEEKGQKAAFMVHLKAPLWKRVRDNPATPAQSLTACQGREEAGATRPLVTFT